MDEDETSLLETFTKIGEKENGFRFLAENPDMFLVRFNKWRSCLEIYIDDSCFIDFYKIDKENCLDDEVKARR